MLQGSNFLLLLITLVHRISQRGHSVAVWKYILGIKLADWKITISRIDRASHTICKVLCLFLVLLLTCYIGKVFIFLGPPPSVAYPCILDVVGYPQQVINFFIVCVSFFFDGIDLKKSRSSFLDRIFSSSSGRSQISVGLLKVCLLAGCLVSQILTTVFSLAAICSILPCCCCIS